MRFNYDYNTEFQFKCDNCGKSEITKELAPEGWVTYRFKRFIFITIYLDYCQDCSKFFKKVNK